MGSADAQVLVLTVLSQGFQHMLLKHFHRSIPPKSDFRSAVYPIQVLAVLSQGLDQILLNGVLHHIIYLHNGSGRIAGWLGVFFLSPGQPSAARLSVGVL